MPNRNKSGKRDLFIKYLLDFFRHQQQTRDLRLTKKQGSKSHQDALHANWLLMGGQLIYKVKLPSLIQH